MITIGIRSWMCPAASVASVVITEQVRSQAESSAAILVRVAPDLVDAGHHQQPAVGPMDEERLLPRLAAGRPGEPAGGSAAYHS